MLQFCEMFSLRNLGYLILILGTAADAPLTLRLAADRAGILVGAAVRPARFAETAYSATLAREFNMVEPEDAMKWEALRPTAATYDFSTGDQVVRFAQAQGMKVRGHCLVWDHSNPHWLAQGRFTSPQLSHILREHISTVMSHYTGQVFAWDVVNEALDENGRLKDSIWYNQPGIGTGNNSAYIEQAFRWAHDADPKALLFYNENGGEGLNRKSDAIYTMLRDFKARGVPIDGVGLQMHISRLDYDTAPVSANIARLAALGLQVHITELDVSLPVDANGMASEEDLQKQAAVYRGVVQACLQNPGCTAIQTWGVSDKWSWIGSHSHYTRGSALLFDRMYKPKAAYSAILEELRSSKSGAVGPGH